MRQGGQAQGSKAGSILRQGRRSVAASLSPLRRLALLLPVLAVLLALGVATTPALALKPIVVPADADRIDITTLGEVHEGRGDSLQVESAASRDGAVGRMAVRATTPGTNPNWIVFALTNPSDKPLERWVTADRYNIVGSGAVWPDLDARRIEAVTPSVGFVPERIKSDRADIFRITLEPGQTITYVAELSSERFARIFLWKPIDYEIKVRDRQLFNGILLGLTGLLAIFLTAIFAANHKAIFPAASLVAWCVLAYLCVDFGFFHKLFNLRPEDNAVYRAAAEAAMASSLVIFLHTFLRLAMWHGLVRMLIALWMMAQLSLIAVAVIDPRLAATFARGSFVVIGGVGGLITLFLALRGQDRALTLIPTWMLLLVWIFGVAVTFTGRLSGDVVVSGLSAGLVLIVMLMGFTVTQYAFRTVEPLYGSAPSEQQLRVLAVEGAGAAVWEWAARRDEVKVSPLIEESLGLNSGELSTKVDDFIKHVHPADRERFRLMLWSVQERAGGRIHIDFRMRHTDNSYRCFELEAASVPSADVRAVRCVGLMRDITDAKRAHERLLHDAVHDSLTGLPNRELFLDRLDVAMVRAKTETAVRPTILFIDIDKFKSVNNSFGLVIGDSLLLTIARRLQRHLGPLDTLARVGGDQFAVLFLSEQDPRELASLAERIRRSLRSPIKIAGQDIVLTGSLGIAIYDGEEASHHDLLKEAEIAMYRAKRGGADRIEIFRPEFRSERDDRVAIESDLRRALDKNQLKVFYQPIIYLPTEDIAGFEALVRWEHPKHGTMNPSSFVPVAEESDLIVKLGSYVLMSAAQEAARWHKELPRPEQPLFVSVNVSSRQLFRQDLIQEIRHILGRQIVPKGSLRLEVTETLVMENPEQATEILELLRGAGAELALDDFGAGYSSLSYLQRFPFDTIKIDRSLVQASGSGDNAGAVIVRSMVALAHELGKKVVAEGVETPDDVAFLRSIGCEYAQGYYYGGAVTEKEVIQLLKMVKRSERSLRPRGLFRTKSKKGRVISEPATGVEPAVASIDAVAPATTTAKSAQPTSSGKQDGDAAGRKGSLAGALAPLARKVPKQQRSRAQQPDRPAAAGAAVTGVGMRPGVVAEPAALPVAAPPPLGGPSRAAAPMGTVAPPASGHAGGIGTGSGISPPAAPPLPTQPAANVVAMQPPPLGRPSTPPEAAEATGPAPVPPPAAGPVPPAAAHMAPQRQYSPPSTSPAGAPPRLPQQPPVDNSVIQQTGAPRTQTRPTQPGLPDYSTLPPAIAASLARLAGTPLPNGENAPKPAGSAGETVPPKKQKLGS